MNLDRLRPTGVKCEDLDVWLSGVVNDAIRDAREAGLDEAAIYHLLKTFTETNHPLGYKFRNVTMSNTKTKPATLFDIRGVSGQKGTLLIADFNDGKGKAPDFLATLAPPPFASSVSNDTPTQSAAVRAIAAQVKDVLDQLTAIAANLEQNGR